MFFFVVEYTLKSVSTISTSPFGEVSEMFLLQLSSQTHFAKIEDKTTIVKN